MNYFLVLDVLVLIVLAVCLLGGLIRGFKKSLRKLIALAIPTICLFIFLGPITNAVMNIEVDLGKINNAVLQNTQQEYAFKVGQLRNEFIIPSVSEMEAITNMLNILIPRVNEFSKGFRTLGNKEYINKH